MGEGDRETMEWNIEKGLRLTLERDWQVARDRLKLQGVCDLYKVQIG